MYRVNKRKQRSLLSLSYKHKLHYKYVGKNRRGLDVNGQTFRIDGEDVPHYHHPLGIHGTATRKARPRVQLTDGHADKLKLPVIDEHSPDLTKVVFPNGRVNYVLMARRESECQAFRSLHKYMVVKQPYLDEFLTKVGKKRLLKDDLGGGRYIASGFGTMGKNVSPVVRPPNQPALRQCLKHSEHLELARIAGGVFSKIAVCIDKHCDNVYGDNQKLMKLNPNMAWPPLKFQESECNWMSSQFIVRRWGPALAEAEWPLEKEIVAAHTDQGDLDCTMFNCYTSSGGNLGKGGPVKGTDLAVFEKETGGSGFRVKTCIEDTVVIVVMNSKRQLHSCIKSRDSNVEDGAAWSTRIIPYVTLGVHNWMTRHPYDIPFTDIP